MAQWVKILLTKLHGLSEIYKNPHSEKGKLSPESCHLTSTSMLVHTCAHTVTHAHTHTNSCADTHTCMPECTHNK